MSKKFLKDQAQELLTSELKRIKGGTVPPDCAACESGCMSSCQVACVKGKSQG